MFTFWMALLANVLGTAVLVYVVYFRRHHRRDLALAYVALSVGLFAVTLLLSSSGAGAGLGLGLFGILSIIRLRSDTLTQEEVAYYFISLAMGLVNGLHPDPVWLAPSITAALVLVMFVADHPRFAATTSRQVVTMDAAYPRRVDMVAALETLLGARILRTVVLELDMVRDTTVVDVRFRELPTKAPRRTQGTASDATPRRQEATAAPVPVSAEREYANQGQGSK